jgi:hypothetical protein
MHLAAGLAEVGAWGSEGAVLFEEFYFSQRAY